jgi:LPXTG-motif cell wall-anchored protein
MGVAVVGVLGALFAMPMLTAGAQEGGPPPSPGQCTFAAAGTVPGTVTVTGTVPNGATEINVTFTPSDPTGPAEVHVVPAPSGGGPFTFQFNVTVPGVVSVNYVYGNQNAYSTGCSGPSGVAGISVTRARTDPTVASASASKALAFTGSNNTPSYVLIGIAALVLGAVLVVAAKRHSRVS